MSVAIRSPRQSALGVRWCEDFSRGRAGVVRNQGVITEAAPNVIGFDGEWAVFPGSVACRLVYPHLNCLNQTEITICARIKNVADGGTYQNIVGQDSGTPANNEFGLFVRRDTTPEQIVSYIGSVIRSHNAAYDLSGEHFICLTWVAGVSQLAYLDDQPAVAAVASVPPLVQPTQVQLHVGGYAAGGFQLSGRVRDLVIDFRAWSASEIAAYRNRSLFI